MEICSKTHQIAPFPPKIFWEACPRTPEQTLGYATRRKPLPPPKKNSLPLLANPAYAHELLLRNLFENPRWQTVDCV